MARHLPARQAVGNGPKTGENGRMTRDAKGRFVAGNPGGGRHANPFARYQAELRGALLAEVAPADLRVVITQVLRLAKGGNLQAAELVLKWTLGGPPPVVDPDALDAHELTIRRGRPTLLDWLSLSDEQADREPAERESLADSGQAFPEAEAEPPDPLAPALRQTLAWAIEELAQARYALRMQRPPDPLAGWAHFVEQRLEFDEGAAAPLDLVLVSYWRWCGGHGAVPLEEDKALAWLTQHGVTRRPEAGSPGALLVGVRVVA